MSVFREAIYGVVFGDERKEGSIERREEIVRCRDCVHYKQDPNPIDPGWPMWCEDTGRDMIHPDGFCAWGERKGRMSELKPCPFCGGEASKRLFYKGHYRVHCNVCDAHSGDVCATEAEAIASWNTRAERTCHATTNERGYAMCCSECGQSLLKYAGMLHNYCPNCGRKVVQDE